MEANYKLNSFSIHALINERAKAKKITPNFSLSAWIVGNYKGGNVRHNETLYSFAHRIGYTFLINQRYGIEPYFLPYSTGLKPYRISKP